MKKQNNTYTAFIPKTKKATKKSLNLLSCKLYRFLVKSKKNMSRGVKWVDNLSAKKIRSFTKRKSRK